jgi:hypothetical protein
LVSNERPLLLLAKANKFCLEKGTPFSFSQQILANEKTLFYRRL